MKPSIAVILPSRPDHLARTIVDGLAALEQEGRLTFHTSHGYEPDHEILKKEYSLPREEFISYAQTASCIMLIWGKDETDYTLAHIINAWQKTVFIDGSEVGKNRRFDALIQYDIERGTYAGQGKIDDDMLKNAQLYFRREKPYRDPIIPLPFGIESRSIAYTPSVKKDIDFFCVFGQDEYPLLRRYATQLVKEFAREHKLTCITDKLEQKDFYKTLARSKFGISIGGGGFDTGRFWEILGNNTFLLTESIDIFNPDNTSLDYSRIWQFKNIFDLAKLLEKAHTLIQSGEYDTIFTSDAYKKEYEDILHTHSSKARVEYLMTHIASKLQL